MKSLFLTHVPISQSAWILCALNSSDCSHLESDHQMIPPLIAPIVFFSFRNENANLKNSVENLSDLKRVPSESSWGNHAPVGESLGWSCRKWPACKGGGQGCFYFWHWKYPGLSKLSELIEGPQDREASPQKKSFSLSWESEILHIDFHFPRRSTIPFSSENRKFPCQGHFYLQILHKITSRYILATFAQSKI